MHRMLAAGGKAMKDLGPPKNVKKNVKNFKKYVIIKFLIETSRFPVHFFTNGSDTLIRRTKKSGRKNIRIISWI